MDPNKRRKLDPQAGKGPLMSAFAARKSLWGAQIDSSAVEAPRQKQENNSINQEISSRRPSPGPQESVQVAEADTKSSSRAPVSNSNGRESPGQTSSASVPTTPSTAQLQISDASQRTILQFSSFKPNRKNYQQKLDGRTILKLADGERIVILGSYGLGILEGEVTILGATIRAGDPVQWIHASHCHALPVLRTTKDTTVELRSHPAASDLRALERLSLMFGKLWNETSQPGPGSGSNKQYNSTFQIVYTSEDGPKRAILQDLVSPAEWNKKIAELAGGKPPGPPVLFICGPKSSGKSTFGKLLTNRLVTNQASSRKRAWQGVAVLDLDPGQPEYSAPGVVSLVHVTKPNLAPPFCHPCPDPGNRIVRSHAIASVTPALDPEHYLECALDLFGHYRDKLGTKSPLIVNTPGWIQGTGLDMLLALVEKIRPSEVIYMSQEGPEETVDGLRAACRQVPLSALPSQASEYASRTALHLRAMQAMSYFHSDKPSLQSHHSRWDPRPLADMPPWKVRFRGPSRGFLGLLCYDYQPPPNLLVEAINGMIVGLAAIEQNAALRDLLAGDSSGERPTLGSRFGMELGDKTPAEHDEGDLVPRTPEGIPFIPNPRGRTLNPRYSRLLGLALIRGIDVRRGELHILTPLLENIITDLARDGKKLVLVAGKFDTPSWAYTEDLYKRSYGSNVAGNAAQGAVEVTDEDTDDDSSQGGAEESVGATRDYAESPWVELLHGNQKRTVGSRVWRVRRDLGRGV